ncbi:hypothetical protein CACET_c21420 [Clostridium aceticum]|uniref:Uncharacterized protein n=1 Tax=Clostridium aceticum TaxID=84022 RepID=A0A0D8I9Y9_9CLOT|nr:hypothetical protein [Clostridium aceticum]AKL95589.1 hypothetical protein CACET_c21420 [Clostridium aceticum]KJF26837.1 hypothetical protein TZ02_11540 [Clostridium aceticum]
MSRNQHYLSDFIHTAPGFQYSINLKYDMENIEKIKNYIATTSAIEIMEDILLSLNSSSSDRARLLVGPYGKGKSHLVLVIMGLLYYKDRDIFASLLSKLKNYNDDLYHLAERVIADQEKVLPVVVSGTSLNLTQSLLLGLKNALKSEELDGIMPDTYFNAAIEMIELWKKDYTDTYEKFNELIHTSSEEFVNQLHKYNQDVYNEFLELYPQLTSGGEFNPLQGIDIVELYGDVASKIQGKGYKGLYVIYDEFSKFLEGSIDRNSAMEIKLLQDFAEKCNRSGEEQLHILLISHKNISNYVDKLPKEKIDAWKAVGDRYKPIEISHLESQTYEIMSHVILKEEKQWEQFIDRHDDDFNQMILDTSRSGIFSELGGALEDYVVYGTYPLHPITTYILPKVSEKVAQNERTIFTFLSTKDINTLGYFLQYNKAEFPIMTPDYIYNYFEPLFKKENYVSEIYQIWRETTTALKKLSDGEEIEEAIVKTLGLINIVGEFQKLPPKVEVLQLLFSNDTEAARIKEVVGKLIDQKVLYFIKSKGYLEFANATDMDISADIADTIEKRKNLFSSRGTLNKLVDDSYIYAAGYNDEYEIIRYFDFEFIEYRELMETRDWNKKIQSKTADGVVYAVILEKDNSRNDAETVIPSINHDRAVFVLPKENTNLEDLLRQHDAIEFLIGKNKHEEQDKLLHEELSVYLEDIRHQIQYYIDGFLRPELKASTYYYQGKVQNINRKALLTRLISRICETIYSDTPIIVNELINKNMPTITAISNRRKVLDGLLRNSITPRLGLVGYGLDVSIMQSTLVVPGILKEEDENAYLCTKGLDPKMQKVLDSIRSFIISTSNEGVKPFSELYEKLIKPEYHMGLKKGIIPIYLAVVLRELKRYTVIVRNGQEMDIKGQLLDDINEKPEEFEVYLENWDEEKESYIQHLEGLFYDYIEPSEKEYNTFEYVFRAIHRWFLALPKYTKEHTQKYLGSESFNKVDRKILRLRNTLKGTRMNSRDFLFSRIFDIFCYGEFSTAVLTDIIEIKEAMDGTKEELINILANDLKVIFSNEEKTEASLSSIMKDWYEGLDQLVKENLFSQGEDQFLKEVQRISNNHYEFIEKIAKLITGLRIDDWDDKKVSLFIERVKLFKGNIEAFSKELQQKGVEEIDQMSYKVSFYLEGEEKTKSIVKQEVSNKGKLLYNEIESILNDYGTVVDTNEKRQILLEIFEKCC